MAMVELPAYAAPTFGSDPVTTSGAGSFGGLTCTSLTAGSGAISTTGTVGGGATTITTLSCTTVSATAVTCTSVDASAAYSTGAAGYKSTRAAMDGGTTTDSVLTSLTPTLTIVDATGGMIKVDYVSHKSDGSITYFVTATVPYKKVAGTLTLGTVVKTTAVGVGTITGMDVDIVASSNNVRAQGKGPTSIATMRWTVSYEVIYRVSSA